MVSDHLLIIETCFTLSYLTTENYSEHSEEQLLKFTRTFDKEDEVADLQDKAISYVVIEPDLTTAETSRFPNEPWQIKCKSAAGNSVKFRCKAYIHKLKLFINTRTQVGASC